MAIERTEPDFQADERAMLTGWLDYHRSTLEMKCHGLSDDQLRVRSAAPSAISLLGLVRHMAEVERWWFRRVIAGESLDEIYCTEDNRDGDWDDVADADVVEDFATWRAECAAARAVERSADTLDVAGKFAGSRGLSEVSLRWVLTHMIEEYARHNGHADLVRERIDGATGD